ncbi:DUF371 domain-containing protein [Candidatus Woesearchaeota archaeon]|nr:DUF371 domain-containing protein [Candidatus Woesearchaeota archaeon]
MYSFRAYGHPNVLGTHRNTFEFTKDAYLTPQGDCIIGIKADFSLTEIKKQMFDKIKITITTENVVEVVHAIYNPSFSSDHEMVIRITDYKDARTFAAHADKAAKHLSTKLTDVLKNPLQQLTITICPDEQ